MSINLLILPETVTVPVKIFSRYVDVVNATLIFTSLCYHKILYYCC